MDTGPGAALGSVGWFTGIWATMMAAMMLPSLAPAAASFAPSARRELTRVLLFAAGYLAVWSLAGSAPTASSSWAGRCWAAPSRGTAEGGRSPRARWPWRRSTS